MEHKTWWRKKGSEKTITISNNSDPSLVENKEEKLKTLELERSLKDLNEQLSDTHNESNAKDGLLTKQAKVAAEAIAGWEKAEAEAVSLKQQLDDALLQKSSLEERIFNADSSLMEYMQKLHVLKVEKQNIMSDASLRMSREHEKARLLEESLAETNKMLAKLKVENSSLSRIFEVKDKLIDDLSESKSQSEAKFNAVVVRLDSLEKTNASLNYEVGMLQKELEIRNKDREFNLRSADAAHKQHLESIKKITKLETECQRLRSMVRKRLPGPAAIAKMRSEVEMRGNSSTEIRGKRSNYTTDECTIRDFALQNCYDSPKKSGSSFIERLNAVEDENKILKETLTKKNGELQSSRVMFARTASKLSLAETQLEELSKGQISLEIARCSPVSYDLPLRSISEDGCNEDSSSCTESWASALISELEHFKTGKPTSQSCRTAAVSDLSELNDFVEMEKLAIVSLDKPFEASHWTSRGTDSKPNLSKPTGLELVPMDSPYDCNETKHRIHTSCASCEKLPNLFQDILRVVLLKHHIPQRSLDAIIEDTRVALGNNDLFFNRNSSAALYVSGNICQKPHHTSSDSSDGAFSMCTLAIEKSNQHFQSDLEKSVHKLIELIEGVIRKSKEIDSEEPVSSGTDRADVPYGKTMSLTGYVPHVFLWQSSELRDVLQHFTIVCNDLLCGKSYLEKFVCQLTSTLDWIVNHCFPLQDVSIMKAMIKRHFDVDKSHSDDEFKVKINNWDTEIEKLVTPDGLKVGRCIPLLTMPNGLCILPQMDNEPRISVEYKKPEHETTSKESETEDSEMRIEFGSPKNETMATQLQEAKESISNSQVEVDILKNSKGLTEDQTGRQKVINTNVGTQLTVCKLELNEVEPEEKSNHCDELEATCLDLQLQLESVASKGTLKNSMAQDEKQLRTDWEISAASAKLAECQEKILNLGKQLKALASPKDSALLGTPRIHRRTQLLDQMRAEDEARFEDLKSPKMNEVVCTESGNPNAGLLYGRKLLATSNSLKTIMQPSPNESFHGLVDSRSQKPGALVLVPKRQKGRVGLLRKLLSRRKKESDKMLMLSIAS